MSESCSFIILPLIVLPVIVWRNGSVLKPPVARTVLASHVGTQLTEYFSTNPDVARAIVQIGNTQNLSRDTGLMSEVRLINEKPPENQGFLELARPGFEPGQTEPKSVVLPLHYRAPCGA